MQEFIDDIFIFEMHFRTQFRVLFETKVVCLLCGTLFHILAEDMLAFVTLGWIERLQMDRCVYVLCIHCCVAVLN